MYFDDIFILENTLLPYFYNEHPLKLINRKFNKLNYKKYNTPLQPHCIIESYNIKTKTIASQENYKNDKLDGLQKFLHLNGNLWEKINYVNGKLHGLYEHWYENGQLFTLYNYKNGKLDGLYKEWRENGQLKERSNYKNGEKDGLCEKYSHDGELISSKNYENNVN